MAYVCRECGSSLGGTPPIERPNIEPHGMPAEGWAFRGIEVRLPHRVYERFCSMTCLRRWAAEMPT